MRLPRQGTGCKSWTNRSLYAGSAAAEGHWCVRTCMRRTEKAQAAAMWRPPSAMRCFIPPRACWIRTGACRRLETWTGV